MVNKVKNILKEFFYSVFQSFVTVAEIMLKLNDKIFGSGSITAFEFFAGLLGMAFFAIIFYFLLLGIIILTSGDILTGIIVIFITSLFATISLIPEEKQCNK